MIVKMLPSLYVLCLAGPQSPAAGSRILVGRAVGLCKSSCSPTVRRPVAKPYRGPPMTLGAAAAAQVRLMVPRLSLSDRAPDWSIWTERDHISARFDVRSRFRILWQIGYPVGDNVSVWARPPSLPRHLVSWSAALWDERHSVAERNRRADRQCQRSRMRVARRVTPLPTCDIGDMPPRL
jgi:hypothetical protein